MSEISALPGGIVDWLKTRPELANIRFITEFPPAPKAIPLKKVTVAVGIEDIIIEDSFTENDEGVLIKNEHCRLAAIKIKFAVHVPFALGGEICYDVFTDVVDCLNFGSELNILNSGCGQIKADRDTDALVLSAFINIQADFCPAVSTGLSFTSFLSKDLLCGSHISDSEIHVTGQDKELWNSPFVTGSYFGNGMSSRTITLGFRPKTVAVFAAEYPSVTFDASTGSGRSYWGFAAEDGGTLGLELGTSGFKLLQGSAYTVEGCSAGLNLSGAAYFYIAFK